MLKYRIATVAGIAVALPVAAAHAQDDADRSQSPGAALMSMYDDDGDGRLTRKEAEATSFEGRFDKMDKNGDGELDEEELEAAYGSGTTGDNAPIGDS